MSKIVIIGAGAMGSAFAVPCADNSNEVFLVGSFLEDSVIEEIKSLKNFHPILKTQLPENIKVLKFSELKASRLTISPINFTTQVMQDTEIEDEMMLGISNLLQR